MSTEKYISDVKIINHPQELVFEKLSNLKRIEKFFNSDKIETLKKQASNIPDFKIEDFEATEDECSFKVDMLGKTGIRIIEREPNSTIKFTGNGNVPFNFFLWIQVVPLEENSCKIKFTIHADLNPMIKMMVNKHLKEGINKLADVIASIPFDEVQD
jgi:ribosome-associated toxin RatA of RatAB toxin-antitoxin module